MLALKGGRAGTSGSYYCTASHSQHLPSQREGNRAQEQRPEEPRSLDPDPDSATNPVCDLDQSSWPLQGSVSPRVCQVTAWVQTSNMFQVLMNLEWPSLFCLILCAKIPVLLGEDSHCSFSLGTSPFPSSLPFTFPSPAVSLPPQFSFS